MLAEAEAEWLEVLAATKRMPLSVDVRKRLGGVENTLNDAGILLDLHCFDATEQVTGFLTDEEYKELQKQVPTLKPRK